MIKHTHEVELGNDFTKDDMGLVDRYPEVPHECDDPKCPGNINRRIIENGENAIGLLKKIQEIMPCPECHYDLARGQKHTENCELKSILDEAEKIERGERGE